MLALSHEGGYELISYLNIMLIFGQVTSTYNKPNDDTQWPKNDGKKMTDFRFIHNCAFRNPKAQNEHCKNMAYDWD